MIDIGETFRMVLMIVGGVSMFTTLWMTAMYYMMEDWMTLNYDNEDQMNLRQQALLILFKNFGDGSYSNRSIYECADEWCSKQVTTSGLVKYYKAYYSSKVG